jgi:hypothetical protein
MEVSCRSWRKEIRDAVTRKRAEELRKKKKKKKMKKEKTKQACIMPGRVISDALVVRPHKHSDRR